MESQVEGPGFFDFCGYDSASFGCLYNVDIALQVFG